MRLLPEAGRSSGDVVEMPTAIFILLMNSVGGSLVFNEFEIANIRPKDWKIEIYDELDPPKTHVKITKKEIGPHDF